MLIAYAENDTDEFRRQSMEFARGLQRSGKLYGMMLLRGIGHFAILDELYKPGSELLHAVLAHATLVTGRYRST